MSFSSPLINGIWFQIVWWGMVFRPSVAMPLGILFVILHFLFLKSNKLEEALYTLVAFFVGISVDTVLSKYGVLNFYPGQVYQLIPPNWLIVLWLCFSCTLRFSLRHIVSRLYIAIPLGGIGGAFCYFGVEKFGILDVSMPDKEAFVTLTVVWGCLFALFSIGSHILDENKI